MRLMCFLLIILLLVGCEKSEIERGISLQQLEHRVSKNEAEYIKEMEAIFSIYNLSLYDIQYSRSATFYYFISSNVVFNMDIYREIVSKNLKKNGWTMVEKNEYGELYCNIDNQAIGITFPTLNEKSVGLNKGYFTYQFYKKISITLYYIPNKNSVSCKGSTSKPYLQA